MKKGQNPSNYIALLIFIIGVSLILYILMLPPEDRADLLEQNRTGGDDGDGPGGPKTKITVLKTEYPGTITSVPETEVTRSLAGINLYTQIEAEVLSDEFGAIYVEKSLFEEQQMNVTFEIDDMDNTDNVILTFNTPVNDGQLTIKLNDLTLIKEDFDTQSPAPIKLPSEYLNDVNVLTFSVSGPGMEFWKANKYSIKNLKVIADVTDRSNQQSSQKVVLTEEEYENLDYLELSFLAECRATATGSLQVLLNKYQMFKGVPDCGYPMKLPPADKNRARVGENELIFKTEGGNYLLDQIEVKYQFKEAVFPTYYFFLDSTLFKKIEDDDADINITMTFSNDVDLKKATVFVNGVFFEINNYDMLFNRRIDNYAREGNNIIEIRPDTNRLDVLDLKILIAE